MQHHAEVEPKRIVLDRLARAEEMVLSGQEEEDWCSEEHTTFLQCADSLAIAVNRIGENIFGVKRLLRGLKDIRGGRRREKLTPTD